MTPIGLALFAYSTIISWSYYGDRCAEYLFGPRAVSVYRYLYLVLIVVGAVGGLRVIWALADIFNALMAVPNLIGLVALAGLSAVIILLAAIYGACMGSFNLLHPLDEEARIEAYDMYMQLFASGVKLPLLFFLTLLVTFPSLYVFNALIGSRLSVVSALRLMVASMGVMPAVPASLGPIVIFFSLSTTSYPFMILLNVAMCAVAGILGLAFLLRTLYRLVLVQETRDHPIPPKQPQESGDEKQQARKAHPDPRGALDRVGAFTSRKAINVFRIWTTVFALVGAQMNWVLRPFIGNPGQSFEWFRERESNFFLSVFRTLGNLFSS